MRTRHIRVLSSLRLPALLLSHSCLFNWAVSFPVVCACAMSVLVSVKLRYIVVKNFIAFQCMTKHSLVRNQRRGRNQITQRTGWKQTGTHTHTHNNQAMTTVLKHIRAKISLLFHARVAYSSEQSSATPRKTHLLVPEISVLRSLTVVTRAVPPRRGFCLE